MSTSGEKLKIEVLSDTQIQMTRSFKAPRELVFRAMTEPELVAKWWGQRSTTTIVDKLDARVGGEWRFVQRDEAADVEYAFRGTFLEFEPPAKLVQTFEFEMMPGHVATDAMTLSEIDGGTLITIVSTFTSKEDLDGMLQSGMESGANESYDQLEELLATMV